MGAARNESKGPHSVSELIAGLLSIGVFFAGAILVEVRSMRKDLVEFAQRLANLEGRMSRRITDE